jgi:hypothetical protein
MFAATTKKASLVLVTRQQGQASPYLNRCRKRTSIGCLLGETTRGSYLTNTCLKGSANAIHRHLKVKMRHPNHRPEPTASFNLQTKQINRNQKVILRI